MARYVLVAQNEDGVRVFGTLVDRGRAKQLAADVNDRIEALEDQEFERWRSSEDEEKGMAPDGYGRVGVLVVNAVDVEAAYRWALGELES